MKKRGQRGSGLVEAVSIGILILVITLALIDLIVMVLANSVNDTAAKNAARAAASQPDHFKAYRAAENSVRSSRRSATSFVTSLILKNCDYTDKQIVSCTTKMVLKLPIPVPGVGANFVFVAQSTEPIVATH